MSDFDEFENEDLKLSDKISNSNDEKINENKDNSNKNIPDNDRSLTDNSSNNNDKIEATDNDVSVRKGSNNDIINNDEVNKSEVNYSKSNITSNNNTKKSLLNKSLDINLKTEFRITNKTNNLVTNSIANSSMMESLKAKNEKIKRELFELLQHTQSVIQSDNNKRRKQSYNNTKNEEYIRLEKKLNQKQKKYNDLKYEVAKNKEIISLNIKQLDEYYY